MKKRVLCITGEGFEEIELVTPVDLLLRMGAEVVLASVSGDRYVKGGRGLVLETTQPLAEVSGAFDLVLIPGGPGVAALRRDGRAAVMAREQVESGRLVASICAGPLVLADAGVLAGRRYTAHASVRDQLSNAEEAAVVEDGPVITSRGAGTALDFGLAMVRRLYGETAAEELAASIMAL